jgi:hypothetical protein
MTELAVHTLIGRKNREGGLLLCGLNHSYSKDDERQDAAGIDRSDPAKSSFPNARSTTILTEIVSFLGFRFGAMSFHEAMKQPALLRGR